MQIIVRKAQCLQQLGDASQAATAVLEATHLTAALQEGQRASYLTALDDVTKAMNNLTTTTTAQATDNTPSNIFRSEFVPLNNTTSRYHVPSNIYEENTHEKEDFLNMANRYNLLDGQHESINYMSAALRLR